jgi:hypothetical protein
MANQDKTAKEIMEAIFQKYGFADVKEQKAAAKEAALEAACANPENAPLIMAFKECAGCELVSDCGLFFTNLWFSSNTS